MNTTTTIPKSQRPYVLRRFERGREETIASGSFDEMLEFLSWCLTDRCRSTAVNPYSFAGFTVGKWLILGRKNELGKIEHVVYRIANNDADYSEITPDDMAKVSTMVENHKAYWQGFFPNKLSKQNEVKND